MGTCKTYTQMALHKHEIPDLLSAAAAAAYLEQHVGDGLQEEAMVFALEMALKLIISRASTPSSKESWIITTQDMHVASK